MLKVVLNMQNTNKSQYSYNLANVNIRYLVLIIISSVLRASDSKDWRTVGYLVMSLFARTGTYQIFTSAIPNLLLSSHSL